MSSKTKRLFGPTGILAAAAFLLVATSAPALAQDGDAIAIVEGRPILRFQLVDLLIESHGLEGLQQLILLQVAKQETKRRGIKVSEADVELEFERALERIVADQTADLTRPQKLQVLETVLEQKRVSMAEFRVGMRRNAHLRKLVDRDMKVTETLLREEFARTHGARVVVRHIQIGLNDSAKLNRALDLLTQGVEFAKVAEQLSESTTTASRGGQLPAFTFADAAIPAALRDVAFSLKQGQVSNPIRTGKWFHILKLEQRIAPESVRFEDVRERVERKMRERVEPERMNVLMSELFRKAKIRVIHPKLRKQFDELLRRNTPAPGLP